MDSKYLWTITGLLMALTIFFTGCGQEKNDDATYTKENGIIYRGSPQPKSYFPGKILTGKDEYVLKNYDKDEQQVIARFYEFINLIKIGEIEKAKKYCVMSEILFVFDKKEPDNKEKKSLIYIPRDQKKMYFANRFIGYTEHLDSNHIMVVPKDGMPFIFRKVNDIWLICEIRRII